MSQLPLYVGLDVGGTNMKAGVVDDAGKPLSSISLETEASKGQEHGLERMCESIRQAAAAAKVSMSQIAAIGVATPGTMDIHRGIILDPPNLKPWQNVPVRDHIGQVFGKLTAFQNDANAAAFGEFWVGAGREARSMVLFTLGTGIGGGIILDDHVLEGAHSHGGEVGHMRIESKNGRLCGCGQRGCFEAYGSATSVVKRTQEALDADGGKSALHQILKAGKELTARNIFDAADKGDELAQHIVDETAFYLAIGATNLMHIVNPEMVVWAGGMIAAGEKFLNKVRDYVKQLAFPVPADNTKLAYAQLGGDAGFIGAAACARQLVKHARD
ncbi:MAG: ROK family protein [Gemmataceae bacterium]